MLTVSVAVDVTGPWHSADGRSRRCYSRLALGQEHGPHGHAKGESRGTSSGPKQII